MQLDSCMYSGRGGRSDNEDCVGVSNVMTPRGLFVLADGLGGHGKGEIASLLAVNAALEKAGGQNPGGLLLLDEIFSSAQRQILSRQQCEGAQSEMKTTLVVLLIEKGRAVYGHIGDSRLYYFHRRQIKRLTFDHSVPQMLVTAGEIGEDEIRGHPDRSRLLRVLGAEGETPRYTPCAKPLRLWRGDGLLLCSDGFWELLDEREMLDAFLEAKTPEHWLEKMRCIVELNGAERDMDNYSAIAVTVS